MSVAPDRPRKTPESPRRIAIYLLVGVFVVYLSTWSGAVTFYFEFQQRLPGFGEVLWRTPVEVAAEAGDGWGMFGDADRAVPIPLAPVVGVEEDGDKLRVRFAAGEIRYMRFGPGFMARMMKAQLETLKATTELPTDDAAIFEELMRETPAHYDFSWSEEKRHRYAANLMCKMFLWDDLPVTRQEMACMGDSGGTSALVEYDGGATTIILAGHRGVTVVKLDADAPPAWRASPAFWLVGYR